MSDELSPTAKNLLELAELCDQHKENGQLTVEHLKILKDAACELNDELEERYNVDPKHLEKLKADLDNIITEDQACQSVVAAVNAVKKIVSAVVLGYFAGVGQGIGSRSVQRAEQGVGAVFTVKKRFLDYINQQGEARNSNGLETISKAMSDDAQQASGQKGFPAVDIANDVFNNQFSRNGK